VGGHDDAGVEDLNEAVMAHDFDGLTGVGRADPTGLPADRRRLAVRTR
jgi:hypothetical protein